MKKVLGSIFLIALGLSFDAKAQYASQQNAAYLATIKAVADYKIEDAEEIDKVNELRQDEKFNQKLQKMLDQLNNDRTKTGKNRQVYDILKRAGKDIYDILK